MSLLEGSFYVLRCTGPPSTKRVPEIPHAGGMQYWVDKYLLLNWCARQGLGGLESFTVHVVRVEAVRVRGRDFSLDGQEVSLLPVSPCSICKKFQFPQHRWNSSGFQSGVLCYVTALQKWKIWYRHKLLGAEGDSSHR